MRLPIALACVVALVCSARGDARAQSSYEPRPLNVVMILDVTASTGIADATPSSSLPVLSAVRAFGLAMAEHDHAAVAVVAHDVLIAGTLADTQPALLDNVKRALSAADHAGRFGPSPLWDAVAAAVQLLSSTAGDRAVLLVTDGKSTGNVHGLDEVIRTALENRVRVAVIAGPTSALDMASANGADPRPNLQTLSQRTGGLLQQYVSPRWFTASDAGPRGGVVRGRRDLVTVDNLGPTVAEVIRQLHAAR